MVKNNITIVTKVEYVCYGGRKGKMYERREIKKYFFK